ncbi:vWA domain-containing protein [Gorillibacterium massiliense]|uniref:vWA domain-containing protein n=1 Tax=Gorillibacterium massiliense TaxID=1280390 RepID=UPI0004B826CB|nr:vWA domain-containing protein [Gorillibacterium massiliense]
MYRRKWSGLLFLFSLAGGAAGFAAGEFLLSWQEGRMPNVLLMAIYFGVLGLAIALMSLWAETLSPVLNGRGWRHRHAGAGWKLLVPASLGLLFAAGALFQSIYGLGFGGYKPAQDIVLVIDKSESMRDNDANRQSARGAQQLIERMETGNRVSIVLFNERAELLQPFVALNSQADKDQVIARLDSYPFEGQTNIEQALQLGLDQLNALSDRRTSMVILLSDGYSDVDVPKTVASFKSEGIPLHTVGMKGTGSDASKLLKRLAGGTDGTLQRVGHVKGLTGAFTKIYDLSRDWHLTGERVGMGESSLYYAMLRVLFVAGLGALIGLALGIIFNNRHLAKSFIIGGAIAGAVSGFLLEKGLNAAVSSSIVRFVADIVLAAILAASTMIVAVKESSTDAPSSIYRRGKSSGSGYGSARGGSGSFK